MQSKPVTVTELGRRKHAGERIVMVTAYDATMAALVDRAGVDVILVGDSLGMVIQGHRNTLPVTLEHMIYHTAAVARGARRAQVVADLPFMSYQVSPEQGLVAAGRLVQEASAHAVKLEGGERVADTIARIVDAGIPVMGHIGLTPQSVHAMGGFRVQGREPEAARRILADARAVADAGCYALVLEGIPTELAAQITTSVGVPTIGIGAGPHCDGQVLVCYDLLGLNPDFTPKFVRRFGELHAAATSALHDFVREVRAGTFPGPEHSVSAPALRQGPLEVVRGGASASDPSYGEAGAIYGVPV